MRHMADKSSNHNVPGLFLRSVTQMRASQPLADPVPPIPLEPIPPATVALAQAIECLDSARERLDEAQKAIAALEQLRPAASARQNQRASRRDRPALRNHESP